jgi:hypothetical protein
MVKFGGFKNFFDVLMKGTISHDFGRIAAIPNSLILYIALLKQQFEFFILL